MENFNKLVMKIAASHQFTLDQKAHVQSRLNQFVSHYKTPDHPPYSAMIERAIVELNENGGSSEESISWFLEKEYDDLPWAHSTLLKHHLARLCESSVIILTQARRYVLAGTKLSLKTTTKSKRKPVKRAYKWDWERQLKRRRRKKQLSKKMNQQKADEQLEVIEEHPEPDVQEKLSIEGIEGQDNHDELSIVEQPPPSFESVRAGNLSELGVKSLHDLCPQENTNIQVQDELSIVEQPPPGFESVRAGNLSDLGVKSLHDLCPQVQYVTDERTLSERDQVQFGTPSSEVLDKKKPVIDDALEIKSKVYKKDLEVGGEESISVEVVIESEQAEKSSQALVVAEPKKRSYRKKLRGHELLSKTLRRSSRLQNTPKPTTDEEEKELNLSIVEPQVDLELAPMEEFSKLDHMPTDEEEKELHLSIVEPRVDSELAPIEEFSKFDHMPTDETEKELILSIVEPQVDLELAPVEEFSKLDHMPRPLRRSKRLAELAIIPDSGVCDLVNSNQPSKPQDGEIGQEIILHVTPQKEPENQESELLKADLREIKSPELITYVRRKKKFQSVVCNAENIESPTSVFQDPNSPLLEPVKEASTGKSRHELQPDCRKSPRGHKRKCDATAVRNLRFSVELRGNGRGKKMKHGGDASCNALALRAGETLLPSDVVPREEEKLHEEVPRISRLGRPPKRQRVGRPPKEKTESHQVKEVQVLEKSTAVGRRNSRVIHKPLKRKGRGRPRKH